jgi:hypothetical protein
MEQIRRRLTDITAASDQDSRHLAVDTPLRRGTPWALHPARRREPRLGFGMTGTAKVTTVACIIASASRRGCDFNFFKHVFLESADLFETNEFQER